MIQYLDIQSKSKYGSQSIHKRYFWPYIAALYILLSPISIFMPPINIYAFNINMVRILIFILLVKFTFLIFSPKSEIKYSIILPKNNVPLLFILIYIGGLVLHFQNDLLLEIRDSYNLFSFCIFLILLHYGNDKKFQFEFWSKVQILSCSLAFTIYLLLKTGLISIPTYRENVLNLFELSRASSIIDGTIGIWGLLSVVYINSSINKIKHKELYSIIGIISSIGIVMVTQFRIMFVLYVLIIILWFSLSALKQSKFISITFLILLPIFIAINLADLSKLPIFARFSNLITEESNINSSWQWHKEEREMEVSLIKMKPLAGYGWTVTDKFSIGNNTIGYLMLYGHCIYTALAVRIGLPLALLYIFIFFYIFIKGIHLYKKFKLPNIAVSTIAIGVYLLISYTQNILMTSLTFFSLAIYVNNLLSFNNLKINISTYSNKNKIIYSL